MTTPVQTTMPPAVVPNAIIRRVLAVDDDEYARLLVSRHLGKRGYDVVLATSVEEARQEIGRHPHDYFDCVVTDYMMPGETGVDLIVWMKQHASSLATIMVTAVGEKDIVAQTLRSGASNFLDKPVKAQELVQAVEEACTLTKRRRDLAKTEADAHEVGRIQQRMLWRQGGQATVPLEICHHAMKGAGGDFVTYFTLDENRLLVLAADVSGHDLRAAFVSAYFQGILRGMIEKQTPVNEVLDYFNRFLIREWSAGDSFSETSASLAVCAAIIDRKERKIVVYNYGFPPVFQLNREGLLVSDCRGGGAPLGWFEEASGDETVLPFEEGGSLVFWTDGLDDHANHLEVSPWALATAVLAAGSEKRPDFLTDAPDDIMVLRVPVSEGDSVKPTELLLIAEQYHGGQSLEIDEIQRRWVQSLRFSLRNWDEGKLGEIILCVREVVLNGILHGCKRSEDAYCKLQITYVDAAKLIRIRLDDPGQGHHFDWATHAQVAADQMIDRHRGLVFIHNLASRVVATRNGASILMDFTLETEQLSRENS